MIYLDYQATTPTDPRTLAAMLPFFTEHFANPHSIEHAPGRFAAEAVETARAQIAALIGASPREIIFTSGATEANNLAIKGAARYAAGGARQRIISFAAEHKCVLEGIESLRAEGFEPCILGLDKNGQHDQAALIEALKTPTLLVSAMAVNNETGIIARLDQIAEAAAEAGAMLHSDLAQAAGRIPINVDAMGLSLASLSAHKIYGPKGIGALYVRHKPRTRLLPLLSGGGQERGLRAGTLPTPLIAGMGHAAALAAQEGLAEQPRLGALRDLLWQEIARAIPGSTRNAPEAPRIAGNLSLRLPANSASALIRACPDLAISTGSACSSAEIAPSHVLSAIGLAPEEASRSLRLCTGRFTSAAEITEAARLLGQAFASLG